MKKETSSSVNTDVLENLFTLLKQEERMHTTPDLQDLYDRLYRSLYIMRDFSADIEIQQSQSKTLRSKILRLYRRIWKIGAMPYIRYHNQFHATLINTLFIQNALIKELEAKLNNGQQNNDI